MIRFITLLVASALIASPAAAKPLNAQCGRLYDKVLEKTAAFEREQRVVIDTTEESIRKKAKAPAGYLDNFKRSGNDLLSAIKELVSFGKSVKFGGDDWGKTSSFGGDDWGIAMDKHHDQLKSALAGIEYEPVPDLRPHDKVKSIIADIRRVSRGNCR